MTVTTQALCARAPVIPVLVVHDVRHAVPLAEALVAGGLPVLEVTLRTCAALDAIREISRAVPGATVGAGSVLRPDQLAAVDAAGGTFTVSPGATSRLLDAAETMGMPILPGVQTAGEVMQLLDRGIPCMKFFPAEPAGGAATLKAFAGPLSEAVFCPTGGIGAANAARYLALDNVLCVGGSWIAPRDAVEAGDWARIESLASEAARMSSSGRGGRATR